MSEDKIYFSATILVLAAAGFVVNVSAIVVLSWRAKRRHKSSMFHDLLRLMAVYDSVVVLGCAMLYALPTLWHHYRVSSRSCSMSQRPQKRSALPVIGQGVSPLADLPPAARPDVADVLRLLHSGDEFREIRAHLPPLSTSLVQADH